MHYYFDAYVLSLVAIYTYFDELFKKVKRFNNFITTDSPPLLVVTKITIVENREMTLNKAIDLAKHMWDATIEMLEVWKLGTLDVLSSFSSTRSILHEIAKISATKITMIVKI